MTNMKEQKPTYKKFRQRATRRDAIDAFTHLEPVREGHNYLIRFSKESRIEHLVLMISVFMLALTGLSQTFMVHPFGKFILTSLGGLESTQNIHHFFALLLGLLAAFHLLFVLDGLFVRRINFKMIQPLDDLKNIFHMFGLLLGFYKKLPIFDRYKPDEKFIYWMTVKAVIFSGLTGLLMLYPVQALQLVPGSVYPFAVLIHRWMAILVVLIVVVLHGYQTLVIRRNWSIFNGRMALIDMKEEHPVELAYLNQAALLKDDKHWPHFIEFSVEVPRAGRIFVYDQEMEPAAENVTQPAVSPSAESTPPIPEAVPLPTELTPQNVREPDQESLVHEEKLPQAEMNELKTPESTALAAVSAEDPANSDEIVPDNQADQADSS